MYTYIHTYIYIYIYICIYIHICVLPQTARVIHQKIDIRTPFYMCIRAYTRICLLFFFFHTDACLLCPTFIHAHMSPYIYIYHIYTHAYIYLSGKPLDNRNVCILIQIPYARTYRLHTHTNTRSMTKNPVSLLPARQFRRLTGLIFL